MKYELRENQGISAPLLALMAVATGLRCLDYDDAVEACPFVGNVVH